MKTQKQLPKLFYIQENEKTNEYCERLGFIRENKTQEHDYGDYLVFKGNRYENAFFRKNFKYLQKKYPDAVFVDLSDYLDQEQPEKKWQDKTRGGHVDIKEIKQIGNKLAVFGIRNDVVLPNDNSRYWFCDLNGINIGGNPSFDLIPYNPLLTTLEKELEEVRLKEKEILEKIEQLKTKQDESSKEILFNF